jgi:hypothetical protein
VTLSRWGSINSRESTSRRALNAPVLSNWAWFRPRWSLTETGTLVTHVLVEHTARLLIARIYSLSFLTKRTREFYIEETAERNYKGDISFAKMRCTMRAGNVSMH